MSPRCDRGPRAAALRFADDGGAAVVEFVLLAVVLIVPLVYLVLAVFEVQRAAFATSSAAREAARVFVVAPSSAQGELRARQAVSLAMADQGLDGGSAAMRIECLADPCLTPGARVRVEVDVVVGLPFVPWLGDGPAGSVPVRASHTQTVDVYSAVRP
jgi:Flp pilus assembly protein TadG